MGRVRYVRNQRDIERAREQMRAGEERSHAFRSIRCVYETDAEVVSSIVPRPLEVLAQPEVEVEFRSIDVPAAGDVTARVLGASVGVRVVYDGIFGVYPLSMPTSDGAWVASGRERFGEPRKLAEIELSITADVVSANVVRKSIPYLRATGARGEERAARDDIDVAYCFKAFASADPSKDFDQDPQLVRIESRLAVEHACSLDGGLELWDSAFDPVADLPVRRLVDFEFREGQRQVVGRVLRPVPGDWLIPFLHQRDDEPDTVGVDV